MVKFKARRGDLKWGTYNYPVTKSQYRTATALYKVINQLPTFFCSQNPNDGTIIMGVNHKSVDICRDGLVYQNYSVN